MEQKATTQWHELDNHDVLIRQTPAGFLASVYEARPAVRGHRRWRAQSGRSVLGNYTTPEDALSAAKAFVADDGGRLCTPRDIDRVRKEFK